VTTSGWPISSKPQRNRRPGRQGRAAFDADEDTQIVLVHLIQVIGEAAAGLSDGFIAQHPKVPWRQLIATRNRLMHGYFEVDLDIL
jgi:uncharacterized protein with HEPN domain